MLRCASADHREPMFARLDLPRRGVASLVEGWRRVSIALVGDHGANYKRSSNCGCNTLLGRSQRTASQKRNCDQSGKHSLHAPDSTCRAHRMQIASST
jgi:hypothetical protein